MVHIFHLFEHRLSGLTITVTDVKLQLGPAYGDFLASLPPNPSTSALAGKMTDKLVSEFRYLVAQSVGSTAKFLEYLTYGYMIDNVALLITARVIVGAIAMALIA